MSSQNGKAYTSKENLNERLRRERSIDIQIAKRTIQQGLTREEMKEYLQILNSSKRVQPEQQVTRNYEVKLVNEQRSTSNLNRPPIKLPKIKGLPKMSARGKAALMAIGIVIGGGNITTHTIKGANSQPNKFESKTSITDTNLAKGNESNDYYDIVEIPEMEDVNIANDVEIINIDKELGDESYSFDDLEQFNDYPDYKEYLAKLKEVHPNWSFSINEIGLDFEKCVQAEIDGLGVAIQDGIWPDAWYPEEKIKVDGETWIVPSKAAVECMMDTRNFINEDQIFQFETIEFSEADSVDNVKTMLKNVLWANSDKFSYVTVDGETVKLDKSFAEILFDSAKKYGISASFLAAKVSLEQGSGDRAAETGCGVTTGYIGYYNYGNINSYGNGDEIWKSGLRHAMEQGWNTPEKALDALAQFIKEKYVDRNQNTAYSTKYNFDENGNMCHQYMTNFTGAYTETKDKCKYYQENDLMDCPRTFVIPIYKNMPERPSPMPDKSKYINEEHINGGIEVKTKCEIEDDDIYR